MLISLVTFNILFIEASWASTSPINFDALRQMSDRDVTAQIEKELEEMLEIFEIEWDYVIKEINSVSLSTEHLSTRRDGSGNTTKTGLTKASLKGTSLRRDHSRTKTNGEAVEASGLNKSLLEKFQGPQWLQVEVSTGGDDQHLDSVPILADLNDVNNSLDIHKITERQARQAPPNAIYRRKQSSRPCRRRDGTSTVFTGSNAMSYISFLANVMALVLNINNNVNNNNNNNNINSNNNIDNNNANLNVNSNNVNQINIMPPGGRRRRHQPFGLKQSKASNTSCQVSTKGMVELVLETTLKEAWRSLLPKAHAA
ncbi:uncharacterized protein [Palaemon carinicauda]|uniref:uncharacterized protein n=1 Tax=Palaemon carinicauda TaxID=392227 RepID=UPI0035B5F536